MIAPNSSALSDKPDPPETAPKYLIEGFDKQDTETLRALADYAQPFVEYSGAAPWREVYDNPETAAPSVPARTSRRGDPVLEGMTPPGEN